MRWHRECRGRRPDGRVLRRAGRLRTARRCRRRPGASGPAAAARRSADRQSRSDRYGSGADERQPHRHRVDPVGPQPDTKTRFPLDLDIFSPSQSDHAAWYLVLGERRRAVSRSACAAEHSWCGNSRSLPPPERRSGHEQVQRDRGTLDVPAGLTGATNRPARTARRPGTPPQQRSSGPAWPARSGSPPRSGKISASAPGSNSTRSRSEAPRRCRSRCRRCRRPAVGGAVLDQHQYLVGDVDIDSTAPT